MEKVFGIKFTFDGKYIRIRVTGRIFILSATEMVKIVEKLLTPTKSIIFSTHDPFFQRPMGNMKFHAKNIRVRDEFSEILRVLFSNNFLRIHLSLKKKDV